MRSQRTTSSTPTGEVSSCLPGTVPLLGGVAAMDESVRFFVDENDLALGKALAQEHDGVAYPGHPSLPEVPRQTQDDECLEIFGDAGLVVITRDQKSATGQWRRQLASTMQSAGSC